MTRLEPTRRLSSFLALLGGVMSTTAAFSAGSGAANQAQARTSLWTVPELNDQTYKYWVDFVRPNSEELKWKNVGWRTSLQTGREEAERLQRPIFLWTMNGHPMGCT